MNIGLIDVDSKMPNYALMKISAYHKAKGDAVCFYSPLFGEYDRVYMSKVFTFTPDYGYCISNAKEIYKGGTGYDMHVTLPDEIDRLQPDYTLYGGRIDHRTCMGFLTRGCVNKCKWCIVPRKEGGMRPYMDIDEITQDGKRPYAILMDNNVLASDYGLAQIEKIAEKGYHIDFNQGLDARLVTPEIAKLLARVKWTNSRMRFGCDTPKQIQECDRATDLIMSYGYKGMFFFYCIIIDMEETLRRVNHWKHKGTRYIVQAQPYRDFDNPHQALPQWQKDMARWANKKEIFSTTEFADYSPRKGFTCKEYFK